MNYTYPINEMKKLPGHRTTEPALQSMFEAKTIKDERETEFTSEEIIEDKKAEFLSSIKDELDKRSRALKFQLFEIGKLLCAVKKRVPHGEFQTWVEDNFEHGYRTANNCMKVYEVCMGHPEVVCYFNPSCLYIICKPNFPEDLREALFQSVTGPVEASKKDIIELSMKYKNDEISLEDEPVQQILNKQKQISLFEKFSIELLALRKLVDDRFERIKSLCSRNELNPLVQPKEELDRESEKTRRDVIRSIKHFKEKIEDLIQEIESKTATDS